MIKIRTTKDNNIKKLIIKYCDDIIFNKNISEKESAVLAEEFFHASQEININRFNKCMEFNHIDHDKHNEIVFSLFDILKPDYSEVLKLNIHNILFDDDLSKEEKINKINLLIIEN